MLKLGSFLLVFTCALGAVAAKPIEQEAREILDAVLSVDTSHGGETAALRPIAERFAQAGIAVEVFESAPGRGSLIARLKGQGKRRPLLLLAHVDVVPTTGQPWTTDPYQPIEKDGYLYARGVGDDKSMVAAFTAIALELARDKTPLSRDVIVALTAGEETGGATGLRWLLKREKEAGSQGLGLRLSDAEVALNEGGSMALSRDEQKLLFVGISSAEKGYQSFTLTVKGKGGHASVPNPLFNPVTQLARALVKLGELRFAAHVVPAAKDSLALRANFVAPPVAAALRHVVASAPLVAAEDERVLMGEPVFNSTIHTTCVATMLEGSPQENVLPTSAMATVNCRILPDESIESTRDTLVRAIADPAVEVKVLAPFEIAGPSPLTGEVPAAIQRVTARLWPTTPVVHMLQVGTTDSRYLRQAGIAAYGMSAWPMSSEDVAAGHGAHGPDERRPLRWWKDGVHYLRELTRELVR